MSKRMSKSKALSKVQKKEVKAIAKRAVKSMGELNFHVYGINSNPVGTLGFIADLSVIAQGDGDQNRQGDEAHLTSMEFKYDWEIADVYNRCRVIIFRWLDDAAPSIADILLGGVSSVPQVYSSYNKDGRNKFNVLYDKTEIGVERPSPNFVKFHESSRKLTGTLRYNAGGTAGTGHIHLLAISDSAVASDPSLTFTSRINYLA